MPAVKFFSLPSGRMTAFFDFYRFKDCAILEYGTSGHGVTNLGHIPYLVKKEEYHDVNSLDLKEIDIALGATEKLEKAISFLVEEKRFDHILLLPSAFTAVLGIDLEDLSDSLSKEYGVPVFTLPLKMDSDFIDGEKASYEALSTFLKGVSKNKKHAFNLLGDSYSDMALRKHSDLTGFLSKILQRPLNRDVLEIKRLSSLSSLLEADLNTVTTKTALPLARRMKEDDGIDYLEIDELLDSLILSMNLKKCKQEKQILVYAREDILLYLKKVFESIGWEDVQFYATHGNTIFPFLSPDDFIDRFYSFQGSILTLSDIRGHFENALSVDGFASSYTENVLPIYSREGLEALGVRFED